MTFKQRRKAYALDILLAVGSIGDWRSYGVTNVMVAGLLIVGVASGQVTFLRAVQLLTENALICSAVVFLARQAEKLRLKIR